MFGGLGWALLVRLVSDRPGQQEVMLFGTKRLVFSARLQQNGPIKLDASEPRQFQGVGEGEKIQRKDLGEANTGF